MATRPRKRQVLFDHLRPVIDHRVRKVPFRNGKHAKAIPGIFIIFRHDLSPDLVVQGMVLLLSQ